MKSNWVSRLSTGHQYAIAITTVALLILVNQLIIQKMLKERRGDAVVINLAGKQRMLSQKIGLLSHQAVDDFTRLDTLQSTVAEWNNIHNGLMYGSDELRLPVEKSKKADSLLALLDPIQTEVKNTIQGIDSAEELQSRLDVIDERVAEFLPIMNQVVFQIQEDSENQMERLILFEVLFAGISLLILGLEFLFIFRPIMTDLSDKYKKLKKVNESKDRILATVVHDLRNPLYGIKGLAGILKDDLGDKMDDDQQMMCSLINSSADKMERLIEELSDMSELESDEYHLETEVTQLQEYLAGIISEYRKVAKDKGVELNVEVQEEGLKVKLNRQKFSRVLDNLINNALKFTDSRGKVEVSSYSEDGNVIISVKDTGIGIPEELQPIIFNKFTKARRLGLLGEHTTGLGMSIVKQIVQLHNGKIWFKSKEKTGTEFYISIPKVGT